MKPGYYKFKGDIIKLVEGPVNDNLYNNKHYVPVYTDNGNFYCSIDSYAARNMTYIPYMNSPLYKAMYG